MTGGRRVAPPSGGGGPEARGCCAAPACRPAPGLASSREPHLKLSAAMGKARRRSNAACKRNAAQLSPPKALLALVVANARALNEQRGLLGAFSWIGERLLYWAHLQRSNTIEGAWGKGGPRKRGLRLLSNVGGGWSAEGLGGCGDWQLLLFRLAEPQGSMRPPWKSRRAHRRKRAQTCAPQNTARLPPQHRGALRRRQRHVSRGLSTGCGGIWRWSRHPRGARGNGRGAVQRCTPPVLWPGLGAPFLVDQNPHGAASQLPSKREPNKTIKLNNATNNKTNNQGTPCSWTLP